MLITAVVADAFATNCYVVAPAPGEECVIVDPGSGVKDRVDAVVAEHRLRPVAVLLTHGHLDHTFAVTPICRARGVPAYVHGDDAEQLADPLTGLGPALAGMLGGFEWTEPDDVRPLTDGARLSLAGLELDVDHAPGHTRGSVMFRLREEDRPATCLAGDVLFAGSIGRTDLPGGDHATMLRTLATRVLPLADDTVVLPGHGPQTTIGRERRGNPFLQGLAAPAGEPDRT